MKRTFLLGLAILSLVMLLTACGGARKSENTVQPSQSEAASPSASADANAPTYEEQKAFETTIDSFGNAIAKKDFKTAESYCTADFSAYIESMANGTGGVADNFGLAVSKGYALTLKEVKGFYEKADSAEPDFNISQDKPTVDFLVTFEYKDESGATQNAGGYVMGEKASDGTYKLSGFASSL